MSWRRGSRVRFVCADCCSASPGARVEGFLDQSTCLGPLVGCDFLGRIGPLAVVSRHFAGWLGPSP
eukprot:1204466-Pyramimonas_sp.AAC.1